MRFYNDAIFASATMSLTLTRKAGKHANTLDGLGQLLGIGKPEEEINYI